MGTETEQIVPNFIKNNRYAYYSTPFTIVMPLL